MVESSGCIRSRLELVYVLLPCLFSKNFVHAFDPLGLRKSRLTCIVLQNGPSLCTCCRLCLWLDIVDGSVRMAFETGFLFRFAGAIFL